MTSRPLPAQSLEELLAEAGIGVETDDGETAADRDDGEDEALNRLLEKFGVPTEVPPCEQQEQPAAETTSTKEEPDIMHMSDAQFRELTRKFGYFTR